MSSQAIAIYLFAASIVGLYLAYLYGRKTKRFRWSEYFALISVPVAASLSLYFIYGIKVVYFFLVSSFLGFLLEYGVGKAYHMTLNKRLWTYRKYSVGGYTSLLSWPLWGVAGVIFWMVAKLMGL